MKRLICALLVILLTFMAVIAFAEENLPPPENTEISFKVGDSTLIINGEKVTVETPYIAGEGSTLVPLRVITEAFGAEVLWDGETKSITLNYPDVTITLQIDNKTAKVNDHTEELPVAPTLSASGVTMVPLRFISETFGAEVAYDNGLITVTKSSIDFGKILSTLTDKEKIGDSYQQWTMSFPKNLILADKSPNGNEVVFTGENSTLLFSIKEKTDDYSPEAEYIAVKNNLVGNSILVDTDFKIDENKNGYFMIRVKDDLAFADARCHITDKKVYHIAYVADITDNFSPDSYISMLDSFKPEAVTDEVYDISEVKDGLLPYENEKLKLKFMYPVDYVFFDYSFNDFGFYKDTEEDEPYSEFRINIFSVTDKTNAKSLAEADRLSRLDYYNKDFSEISEITEFTQSGTVFYQYTHKISNSKSSDSITTDIFFEKGTYLYNICFYQEKGAALDVDKILKTMEFEELDSKEIGNIIRDDNNPEIMYPVKNKYWSITLPSTWTEGKDNTVSDASFFHQLSDSIICISGYYENTTLTSNQFLSKIRSEIRNLQKEGSYSDFTTPVSTTINGDKYYKYSFKQIIDDDVFNYIVYSVHKDGVTLEIFISINNISYTEKIVEEANSIFENFRIEYDVTKDK